MKALILLIGLLIGMQANAGLFSADSPPKDFLSLQVSCIHCPGVTYSIGDYADNGFTKEASRSWEKVSTDQWILQVKNKDQMTGQTAVLKFLLAKEGKGAAFKRVVVNGEDLDQHTAIRFQLGIYSNVSANRKPASK